MRSQFAPLETDEHPNYSWRLFLISGSDAAGACTLDLEKFT
jgi:hypothetical protein